MRQWASAWFNPEVGSWCVGYYDSDHHGPGAWHTCADERTAKREADQYNAQQPEAIAARKRRAPAPRSR